MQLMSAVQGEPGANALKGPTTRDDAVADFKKKFQDKTKNKWDERDKFKAQPGKYTLLEMGEDDDDDDDSTPKQVGLLVAPRLLISSLHFM